MDKKYKKIYKQYLKEFKKINIASDNFLNLLVKYFKYLRDTYVLTTTDFSSLTDPKNFKFSALVLAIIEYENWQNCITNYFTSIGEVVEKYKEKTRDEVIKLYQEEQDKHWNTFWQLAVFNIKEWCTNDQF